MNETLDRELWDDFWGIDPDTEKAPEAAKRSASNWNYSASIEDALAQLAPFHLGRTTVRELRGLMELLVHRRSLETVKPVRYGLLLQCDDGDYARAFLKEFSRVLQKISLLTADPAFLSEGDELEEPRGDGSFLRVIQHCRPRPADEESESADWENYWKQEEALLKKHPSLIGAAVVSERTVRTRWKKHEHLFYRVYQHHIFLNDLPADDIRDMVFEELTQLGLEMDEPFRQGLEQYIQVVYPKADLKYRAFASDLTNRVLTAYYSFGALEGRLTPRCVPYYHQPKHFDEVLARLNELAGMEPLKMAFQQLYYQKQGQENAKTPLRLHMAFVGNPGTGKTTAARMAADLLYSMGLIKTNKLVSVKSADLISPWVGKTAPQTRSICRSAYNGVLFIDEAYMLAYSQERKAWSSDADFKSQCVDTILQEMEEHADKLVVIFAGYPKPIDDFLNSNEGLRSRVTKIIHFPDFTEEQLLEIFERLCTQGRFTIEKDAYPALRNRIAFEKAGENFGNARSVENIYNFIRAEWQKAPNEQRVFTEAHIRATMPELRNSDIGKMTGLKEIKQQLHQYEKRVKYLKQLSENGVKVPPMNLHMLFMGNPGTGKTTVARIIAEDLYKIGVLKTNKCICVEAHDLLSEGYKAAEALGKEIQRAMGGVLFLDEAYALTEYAHGSVGREVVAALITAMEEHREELVIIFAGYPRNMDAFLSTNPGLRSRIGHTFLFRDYSVQELTDIFLSKMQQAGFILSGGVAKRVRGIMKYFQEVPQFGNGRFVDNLIDQTITCRAMRDNGDPLHYNEITAKDVPGIKALLDKMPDGWRYVDPGKVSKEDKRRTAVHEIGHAMAAIVLEPEIKLVSVSTTDQAVSCGRVEYDYPGRESTERQLMNRISISLAGRAAERIVFGTHSTGCSADYAKAKNIASNMLKYYAMGKKLGSSDIAPLLEEANETVMQLLTARKDILLALADELLEKKELKDGDIRRRLEAPQTTLT